MRIAGAQLRRATGAPREAILFTLIDEEGRRGQGEASPLPGFSRELLAAAPSALDAARWDRLPPDAAPAQLPSALGDWLAAVGLEPAPFTPASALFAAETALLDLLGQRAGLPVHRLLRGGAPARPVPLCSLIWARDPATIADEARRAVARGVHCLKWKIAHPDDLGRERPLLDALRAAAGPSMHLRFDANGAWTLDEARAALATLANYNPEYVEQPVPPHLFDALDAAAAPIAADESLLDDGGPEAVIARRRCRALVLKPMALGGFTRCREVAERARAQGMAVAFTHLFDGPVGLAAAAELALSLDPPPLACGLDLHPGLAAWPPAEVRQIAGAHVAPLDAPGLGLPAIEAKP